MRTATINTIIDDFDVERVNLWDSPDIDDRHKVKGYVVNKQSVVVLNIIGDYALIQNEEGAGWCNKGFIKYDTEKAPD